MRVKPQHEGASKAMNCLSSFVISHRKNVFAWVSLLTISLVLMIPRLEVNDQFVSYFDKQGAYRLDAKFTSKHLSGMYQIQFSIPAGESGGINNPDYLQRLEAFRDWLMTRSEIHHVVIMSDMYNTHTRINKTDNQWLYLPALKRVKRISTANKSGPFVGSEFLRILAIGTIVKAWRGEFSMSFATWVGIPDLLFGLSAVVMLWLTLRDRVNTMSLMVWNMLGFFVILPGAPIIGQMGLPGIFYSTDEMPSIERMTLGKRLLRQQVKL